MKGKHKLVLEFLRVVVSLDDVLVINCRDKWVHGYLWI